MTTAVLSFATEGWVRMRCEALELDERRAIEGEGPFAAWSEAYEAAEDEVEALLGIGSEMGRWIDGAQGWLRRLVESAPAPLVLEIETRLRPGRTERRVLEAPWEIVAHVDAEAERPEFAPRAGATRGLGSAGLVGAPATEAVAQAAFLALDPRLRFTPVRRVGARGKLREASAYRPQVVFMAAQPDGMVGLDVDREEEEIERAAGSIGVDLAVEDRGSLEGLSDRVARLHPVDVVHLSCHGAVVPAPHLVLEDEHGGVQAVTADELASALAEQAPGLVFLSACLTAAASTVGSLAADLCGRGWPGVLGWSSAILDDSAIRYAAAVYRHVARRRTLVDAVAQARIDVGRTPEGAAWHAARLFLGPAGGGKLVDGTEPRVLPMGESVFARAAPVAGARFGHRRALQQVLAELERAVYTGALVHGGDAETRARFAQRVTRRLAPLREVVIARNADPVAILGAIGDGIVRPDVEAILERDRAAVAKEPERLALTLRALLEGPCARRDVGAIVLVALEIDGDEATATRPFHDPPPPHYGRPAPLPLPVYEMRYVSATRSLVRAFRGAKTASQLVITCAAPFVVAAEDGGDVAAELFAQGLGA